MTPDDHVSSNDGLEDRLRRALRAGRPALDPESFLTDVHRGARSRRRRRVAGGVLATAAVVTAAAYGVSAAGILDDDSTPAADRRTTPTVSTQPGPSTKSGSATASSSPSDAPTATTTPVGSRRALSLSATDSAHQYVLTAGSFGCGTGCLRAYTTDDAGQTWSPTARLGLRPSDPDPTSETAYAIRFADQDNGWVFGGGLRSTHDGGASWNRPDLPVDGIVTNLEAWGQRVYASVYDDPTGTTTLLRSEAGLDAWRPVDVGRPVKLITMMALWEQDTAVLASRTGLSAGNELLVSTDDGATWSDVSACRRGYPTSISTSATSLWVTCTRGNDAHAFVSTDNGGSWTRVPGTFGAGSQVQARDDLTAVVIDSNRTGMDIVRVDGEPQRELSDVGDLLPIGFTNPTTGYLRTAEGGILRTVDSGATWQPYPLP